MSTHPFDHAIALQPLGGDRFAGATSPAYANMVGPFGGVSAATLLNAVMQHPQRLGDPVALTVNFAAAVADGAFEVVARPVRTNRSTQHWVVELHQGGEVSSTATVVTAVERETWAVQDHAMPDVPAPEAVPRPARPGMVEWIKRYDMRFIEGELPTEWDGSGSSSRTQVWIRDAQPRALDACSIASMADGFFPRVWLRRATMVPVGTVSMTVYFHAGAAEMASTGTGWLLGQAQAQVFRHGFADQQAQLWNEAGQLLATTHQIVYYKS
jgi:acyl-CoA thioesterase